MIFMQRMKQLVAAVLASDAERVTRELLNRGVLHFVRIKEFVPEWETRVQEESPRITEAKITETRRRIEALLFGDSTASPLRPGTELDLTRMTPVNLEEANKLLDALGAEIQRIRDRQRAMQQEILKLRDIGRQLEMFGDLEAGLKAQSRFSYLSIHIGTVPALHAEAIRSAVGAYPALLQTLHQRDGGRVLLLVSMKRDEKQIGAILDRFGWVDVDFDRNIIHPGGEVIRNLDDKVADITAEQESLAAESKAIVAEKREELSTLWSNLRMNELYSRIKSYFSHTAHTVLFSGWLPADKQRVLNDGIREAVEGRCYLEWNDPDPGSETEAGRIPVEFKGPKFLSPFRMLVANFAIPRYGTVNPTPLVAASYLTMFGLMFGDAGHGLVLVIVGLLARLLLFRRKGTNLRNLSVLVVYCGLAAIVAGSLFGSYFGMQWIKPLWFDYQGVIFGRVSSGFIHDIYGVLELTIYFGIGIIAVGLIVNWVNLLVQRNWLKLLLDKTGIVGGWMYGAGIYLAMDFAGSGYRELPPGPLLLGLLGIPVILMMIKPVLEHRQRRNGVSLGGVVNILMEWIVEILEIASGYLANTLSFMRVAGLGIAHVSLMMAFEQIAEMVGSGVAGVLVLILGNLLVIALEGLSAGIQALRLNYYEFFSKYFTGKGIAYVPVNLKMKDAGG